MSLGAQARALNPLALPALGAAYFMLGAGSLSPIGLVAPMARDLAVSPGSIAFLLTAFALTYAATAPVLQMLIGDWDRRTLVMMGLAALAAGALLCAAAPSYAVVIAGRMVMALGCSLIGPMVSAAAASLTSPERQGAAIGTVLMGLNFSSVLGVPLISYLDGVIGWRWVMALIAAASLVIAATLLATVPAGSRGARTATGAMFLVATDRVLAPALSTTYLQMAGNFATFALAGVYLTTILDLPVSATPGALLAFGVLGIGGTALATWLAGKVAAPTQVVVSIVILLAVFMLLLAPPVRGAWAYPALAAWAVFSSLMQPPHTARLVVLAGERRNLVLALNASLLQLGVASGAALAGLVYDGLGAYWLALASLVLTALSLAAFAASLRSARAAGG